MTLQTTGIHHITAFVQNAQENVDFYAGVLGLRLVKKTINFDAPDVYHLYFGNENGSPSTIITFFPHAGSRQGRIGAGQVGRITFVVPEGSIDFWENRLAGFVIPVSKMVRFSEQYLRFTDKDGLQLEIVEREEGAKSTWSFGGVPADKAVKGFGGAVLFSAAPEKTANVLEQVMGMEKVGQDGDYIRFRATGSLGNLIDINLKETAWGEGGTGTVHHIAWRAKDFEEHALWRELIAVNGFHPTQIIDRQYFNAIYYREAGGILFEIATDPPGFANDEQAESLGEKLMLPEWFEPNRAEIIKQLPPIQVRVLKEDLS